MASNGSQDATAETTNLIGLNIWFIASSTLMICLRLYTRAFMVGAVGIDDYLALVAFVNTTPVRRQDFSLGLLTL